MQKIKFHSLTEFFDFLPNDERQITFFLRDLILSNIPFAKEKLSYNVPFFSLNKGICFIWPSSVFWGNKKTYDGVRLGFSNGYLIDPNSTYLKLGNRKQVSWIDFKSIEEMDVNIVVDLLSKAVKLDEKFKKIN